MDCRRPAPFDRRVVWPLCTVAGMSDLRTSEQPLPTFDESWTRALCVAAHPDDLEYGMAAAVDRWVQQGKTVTYLLATYGEAGIDGVAPSEAASLRAHEEREGAAEVGVEVVEFLSYDDGMVEYGLPLRRDIARVIRIHKPEVIITLTHRERFAGGGTNQADHRVVGLAALDAARDAGNRWIHPDLVDEGYEPWGGVRWVCMAASPEATHGVDVTGHLDAAVASLQAHHAYLEGLGGDYPSPPELLDMVLGGGGRAMGVEHAVTFEVFDI
jgi:LmbE family N-acetylglucosaminyl deacetylase